MIIIDNIAQMRSQSRQWKQQCQLQCQEPFAEQSKLFKYSVAFVPTMGYLHAGHISLIRLAKKLARHVVVSIFVNPSQFNDRSDFERYPSDLPRDIDCLREAGVDAVFTPSERDIYGANRESAIPFQSWVVPEAFSAILEGASRPGHFRGVATVVSMLFMIVEPDAAVFGEKDFQQLRVIEQLVSDLHFPIEIVRGPLVREADGLAMSSRNVRLSPAGRQAALLISQGLRAAEDAFQKGQHRARELEELVAEHLARSRLITPDYIKLVSAETLQQLNMADAPARLLVAAVVDGVRLIDNVGLGASE